MITREERLAAHQAERAERERKLAARQEAKLARSFPVFYVKWNWKGDGFSVIEQPALLTAKTLQVRREYGWTNLGPMAFGSVYHASPAEAIARAAVEVAQTIEKAEQSLREARRKAAILAAQPKEPS